MRISSVLALAVCAATPFAALAQQSTAVKSTTEKVPSGLNFSYDAKQKQIVASGVNLKSNSEKSAGTTNLVGRVSVTVHVKVYSKFEAGTTFHCSAMLLGGVIDPVTTAVDGGLETANTFGVTENATNVSCNFVIPYWWMVSTSPTGLNGLILAYSAAAVNPEGEVQRSTLQVDGVEALPATGSYDHFVYTVAL